ncbi:MAG: hypothetical protein L3K10_07335 [Thermoplasmata archaeon]|nr:hypothetical protein [Thermoplasmata archaeon]
MLFLVVRSAFPLEEEVGRIHPGARLLVPTSVLAELDGLAKSLTPGAMAARALADRYQIVPTTERGDDAILEAADGTGAWVATADRELRRRLAIRGITALIPRDRHRLERVYPRRARGPAGVSPVRSRDSRGNG